VTRTSDKVWRLQLRVWDLERKLRDIKRRERRKQSRQGRIERRETAYHEAGHAVIGMTVARSSPVCMRPSNYLKPKLRGPNGASDSECQFPALSKTLDNQAFLKRLRVYGSVVIQWYRWSTW
jgi:hypothetical protein